MKVLYLSIWYPGEKDQMAGLFVQKHVEAVRKQGADVRVNTFWPAADLVQLNVLTLKWGLVALALKRIFRIPYILVEHWSGYLPQNGQFERFPRWKQALLRHIANQAAGIYPVSSMLEENMKRCRIANRKWGSVGNVVDEFFYESSRFKVQGSRSQVSDSKRFLHVSCFDEAAKNVKGLLRAVKRVSESRQDWTLTLVGTGKDWQMCRDYATELQIPESLLEWTGEVSPEEVCKYMQDSDCLILASRYETYGVPIAEALAVGIPVIESTTCGLQVPKDCGESIAPGDDKALTGAILHMLEHAGEYDPAVLRKEAEQYRESTVGKQLMDIYASVRS